MLSTFSLFLLYTHSDRAYNTPTSAATPHTVQYYQLFDQKNHMGGYNSHNYMCCKEKNQANKQAKN